MPNDQLRVHARVPKLAITTIAFALVASFTIAQNAGEYAGGGFRASESNAVARQPVEKYVAHRRRPNTLHEKRHHSSTTLAPVTTLPPTTVAPTLPPTTLAPTTLPPTTAPPTTAPPANLTGQLIFDDEFDGSSLDLSKWQPNWLGAAGAITKPINSAELSCYDPAQVSVAGGNLQLTAAARSCTASNGVTYRYASGLVETNGRFTFTYGHMEARMWLPAGSGAATNWPAFWADGTGNWPVTGELDVMEGLSGRDCYHFHSTSGGPGACASLANASGWHTFAADWQPGVVTFTYDGAVVGTISSGITSAPMYLILNLGVGGYGGEIQAPATMLVDYVRVWKT